jgi:hypothetical protein
LVKRVTPSIHHPATANSNKCSLFCKSRGCTFPAIPPNYGISLLF